MKKQAGFTLIELIVVIVILGILAATALPKFVDFQQNAADAAVQGVAGGLASASAINYGARQLSKAVTPTTLTTCDDTTIFGLLASGRPENYTVSGGGSCTSGGNISCTVTYQKGSISSTATAGITCYN